MKVHLDDIIEALECTSDENSAYLNVKTGEVVFLGPEEVFAAEKDDDIEEYPDWQQEIVNEARKIIVEQSKDYIELPDNFEIDGYRMMQDFIDTVSDDTIAQTLAISIKGSGAFRRFKEHLYQFGIENDWFAYRSEQYRKLAIRWCEDNNIEYTEKTDN